MSEEAPTPEEQTPRAQRAPRRLSVIWLAPAFALAVVAWLSWHTLIQRGPAITVRFTSADGLSPGETEIRHKGVRVGIVDSFELSPDLSEVIVHARMTRAVTDHLTSSTRFWIVTPRVGTSGITGLNTLVSGAYIEMYPGEGEPQRDFVGLEDPPLLQPDTPGRAYTLTEDELGAVGQGTPVNYHGVQVGQVEGYALDASGRHVNIYAFVRAPLRCAGAQRHPLLGRERHRCERRPAGNPSATELAAAVGDRRDRLRYPFAADSGTGHRVGRPGDCPAGLRRTGARLRQGCSGGGRGQGLPALRQSGGGAAQSHWPAPELHPAL